MSDEEKEVLQLFAGGNFYRNGMLWRGDPESDSVLPLRPVGLTIIFHLEDLGLVKYHQTQTRRELHSEYTVTERGATIANGLLTDKGVSDVK